MKEGEIIGMKAKWRHGSLFNYVDILKEHGNCHAYFSYGGLLQINRLKNVPFWGMFGQWRDGKKCGFIPAPKEKQNWKEQKDETKCHGRVYNIPSWN